MERHHVSLTAIVDAMSRAEQILVPASLLVVR